VGRRAECYLWQTPHFCNLHPCDALSRIEMIESIGLERAGSQREPTGKGVTANYHWLHDPSEVRPS